MNENLRIVRLIVLSATGVALFCLAAGAALALLGQKESALVLLPVGAGAVSGLFGLLAKITHYPEAEAASQPPQDLPAPAPPPASDTPTTTGA